MLALFSHPKEVNAMPYIPKDQIAATREMDLLTYLRRFEPQELVHIGGDTYATRTHDSLKISNGKWCWWSRNIGGTTALDYLTRVEGLSFLDAVQRILGELPHVPPKSEPTAPLSKTEFTLPPKHADNRRVFAYLRSRGIDAEIINHCIKHGQLYEDAEHHNCVFVGYEHGNPAYGALRGTLSDTTFAGEVPSSNKRFSFAVPLCAGGKTLCVFESAIDALSYLTLLKLRGQDWRAANTLSLSGVYQPRKDGSIRSPVALEQYLKDNPGVARIVLCLDNDGMDLLVDVFDVCNGIVATAAGSVGGLTGASVALPQEIADAIGDVGFLASIPLWLVTLLGSLFITVLAFIMILTVYGRFFKIYMYAALSPVALASFAGEGTSHFGKAFLRSYVGVCMEGAVIVLACIIFSAFSSSGTPVVDSSASVVTQVWSYLGEVIFNLLVLVGLVKSADHIAKEMLGL